MFRLTKSTTICTAIAFFILIGGNALAQHREAVQPNNDDRTDSPSLGEVGVVLDFANAQREFRDVLRPKNTREIRELLLSYGLPDTVNVYDGPMEVPVPGSPYTNCYLAPITIYYPNPPHSWPNNPRIIILTMCTNSAGGSHGFGQDWD
ncbi:MAG TPA: hypothetical protein VEY92_04525 [Pseudoxanthomonas sp.]|nr:hypothetical protein [Pseudoxanthomonas sp.]